MKTKITLLALLSLILFVSLGAVSQTQRVTWEYKIENGVSEGKINSLSADGWEVVTAGNYNGGMPFIILRRSK